MQFRANIPDQGYAEIRIEGERIDSVRMLGPSVDDQPFVSPGFIDIQLNGFAGVDFSDPNLTPKSAMGILPSLWETGVAAFCPTLITNSYENLIRNFGVLEEARRLDPNFARSVPCYHLEGPYLSPGEARGIHDPGLMRPPDWSEFAKLQDAAGGRIGILTLAPELPGSLDLIRRARGAGIVVALGHTDATPEQIHAAAECGARLSTHLGNGCPELIHRHRAPLWAQLASDRLRAGLICDGFHLPPELVKIIARMKGPEGCLLVSDAVHVAGLCPGKYSLLGERIELLPTGQVVTEDRRCMAGSALTLNRAVSVFQEFAQVPLGEAIRAVTTNPSRLLPRGETCSEVAEGQPANLVVFRSGPGQLRIQSLILGGVPAYPSGKAQLHARSQAVT